MELLTYHVFTIDRGPEAGLEQLMVLDEALKENPVEDYVVDPGSAEITFDSLALVEVPAGVSMPDHWTSNG